MYKNFYIDNFNINRRIDNYMFSFFKNIPKSKIYCMIRKGKIRVNNIKICPNYKLNINDCININSEINLYKNKTKKILINNYFVSNNFFKNILYEDKYILAINKPYGIPVQGGSNIKFNLISNIKFLYNNNYELIHRLDKDTSGILLISKNINILRSLHKQFVENKIYKKYIALVYGIWNKNNHFINLPIYKFLSKNGNYISKISKFGKKSISIFNVKEYFNESTLLEIITLTGRTHQIRVHSSFFGNPIALDYIYSNDYINKKFKKLGLKRMFLHSKEIKFLHPITKKYIIIKSNIDNNLSLFIENLKNRNLE